MSNMGYCRFQNTLPDLRDCQEALEDAGGVGELSDEEKRAAIRLVAICKEIGATFGEEDEGEDDP